MIRTVLWDLDGTLLDFKASESAAIKKCFEIFGFGECTDEMVARYSAVNMRHWEMLERGERTRDEILCGRFEEFLTSCGLDGSAAEAFNLEYEERLTDTVRFLPGAKETVEALRGRVRQCVVTNGNRLVQYPKLRRSIGSSTGCSSPRRSVPRSRRGLSSTEYLPPWATPIRRRI